MFDKNFYSMHNLVIKMEKGKIYEIVWDNGCFDCDKEECVKNIPTKSVYDPSKIKNYENCKETGNKKENKKENDKPEPEQPGNYLVPKFFITWFGTDVNKRQLKTAGLAMTKFKPYITSGSFTSSIKGLYD